MARALGPGPVFVFECITIARRRQFYIVRALLVLALLVVLGLVWAPAGQVFRNRGEMSGMASRFFIGVVTIQMAVVLLAAPAATAGAVCVDKGRGTLFHVFATDLTGREIVLGKLAARLAPVFGLMCCGLPVLALSGLLGGIEPAAVLGAYLVTAGVGLVGCALGLLLSVWAKKTQHALLPAYALLGAWAGAYPLLIVALSLPPPRSVAEWVGAVTNPFIMLLGPELLTNQVGLPDQAAFFSASALVSALLVALAAARIRPVALGQASRPTRIRRPGLAARVIGLVPGPSLDDNPVLWREWHRKRPSHWTGRFWTAYAVASGLGSLGIIALYFLSPLQGIHSIAAHVNAGEIAVGLLLLSVSAASALTEERDRGSLDVIMATPLPTRSIVLAKWWGTFALVPRLMIFPTWVTCALALISDRWAGAFWMIVLTLAFAATITSLGLALGTWVRHPGRAIVVCVLAYVLVSLGLPLVTEAVLALGGQSWIVDRDWGKFTQQLWMGSPYFAVKLTTEHAGRFGDGPLGSYGWGTWNNWLAFEPWWPLAWFITYGTAASLLLAATVATFDRCLGRSSDARGPRT